MLSLWTNSYSKFVSVIQDFIKPLDKDESFIIPPNMFPAKKQFLLLEIPYCEQNEIASK